MDIILPLTAIAAIASVIGALFATWRWDYARKAFKLQKKQIYLQILMLAESREYWGTPKVEYIEKNKQRTNVDREIRNILRELKNVG